MSRKLFAALRELDWSNPDTAPGPQVYRRLRKQLRRESEQHQRKHFSKSFGRSHKPY